jgi:nitrite reductase/ring-hydroxylating ferredoxin subunit
MRSDFPCSDCDGSRRAFLRDVASALAGIAVMPGDVLPFPIRLATALRRIGPEAIYPIPAQDGATVDREHEVILVRYQDRVYAFGLSCPHQRTPLRYQEAQQRFQCPKHKSTFQMDGAFVSGRATRAMDRYPLRRQEDTVIVDLSALLQEDKDRDRWVNAVLQL